MRKRTLSDALVGHEGERVVLRGWVHRRRRLSSVSFLILRDRRGLAQIVIRDEIGLRQLDDLPEETVVEVEGTVVANPQAVRGFELLYPHITVLSSIADPPPVELWRPTLNATLPVLLDHAPVLWRHPVQQAVWQLAAASLRGFRRVLDGKGFTEIQTPKIVGTSTESGANVFALDYFGKRGYLAQSPQFYKQMLVGVYERVYETGPVFRAEPHDTVRHLAEYVSLDVEFGFIDNHRDVLRMLRDVVAGMLEEIQVTATEAASLAKVQLPTVPAEIPIVHSGKR
jgi:nondiscriminating aspartyl-tRNA synthetase